MHVVPETQKEITKAILTTHVRKLSTCEYEFSPQKGTPLPF